MKCRPNRRQRRQAAWLRVATAFVRGELRTYEHIYHMSTETMRAGIVAGTLPDPDGVFHGWCMVHNRLRVLLGAAKGAPRA